MKPDHYPTPPWLKLNLGVFPEPTDELHKVFVPDAGLQAKIEAKAVEAKRIYPNSDVTITVGNDDVRITNVRQKSGILFAPSETTVTVEYDKPNNPWDGTFAQSWQEAFNKGLETLPNLKPDWKALGQRSGASCKELANAMMQLTNTDPNGWVVTEDGRKTTAARGSKAGQMLLIIWDYLHGAITVQGLPNTLVSMLFPLGDRCQDSILMQSYPDHTFTLICPRGIAWALNELGVTLPVVVPSMKREPLPDSPPPAPDNDLPTVNEFFGYLASLVPNFTKQHGFTITVSADGKGLEVRQTNPHAGKRLLWIGQGFDIDLHGFTGKPKDWHGNKLTYAEAVKWMRYGEKENYQKMQGDWFKSLKRKP